MICGVTVAVWTVGGMMGGALLLVEAALQRLGMNQPKTIPRAVLFAAWVSIKEDQYTMIQLLARVYNHPRIHTYMNQS